MKHLRVTVIRILMVLVLIFTLAALPGVVSGQTTNESKIEDVAQMSLEDLLNVKITTASKFSEKTIETPSTVVVITGKTIAKRGYSDLYQMLQDIPGFDVVVPNGSPNALSHTRGNFSEISERTLLFINGVNYQSLGFQVMEMNRFIPLTAIEQVEIVYGPSSALYGPDAFSGIINIITKSPLDLEENQQCLTAVVSGGSYKTAYVDVSYIGRTEDLGLAVASRYFKSDEPDYSNRPGFLSNEIIRKAWKPMLDRYGSYQDPSNNFGLFARLTYKENLELGYCRTYSAQGSGPQYPLDKTLPGPQWKQYRNLMYLRYNQDISAKMHLSMLLSYKDGDVPPDAAWAERFDTDWNNPNDPGYGHADVSMGYWQFFNKQYAFAQDFVYRLSDQTTINGGMNLAANDFQKGYQINWGDWVDDYETSYTNYPTLPGNNVGEHARYKMTQAGVYLQLKQKFLDGKLVIVPGIRYDYNNIYEDVVNPRIGLSYRLSNKVAFKLNYGSGFQYPSPRNLYGGWQGTIVSANLEPEKTKAIEAGFIFPLGRLQNEVDVYYNRIADTNMMGTNQPERRIYGLEYKLNYHIDKISNAIRNFNFYLNYNWLSPKFVKLQYSATTHRSGKEIGNIAAHKLNFGIDADLFDHVFVQLRNNYVGKRITIISNPIRQLDAYLLSNLVIEFHDLFKTTGLSVSFQINNIFDSEYYHPGSADAGAGEDTSQESLSWYTSRLPQPRRNFMVSLKWEL